MAKAKRRTPREIGISVAEAGAMLKGTDEYNGIVNAVIRAISAERAPPKPKRKDKAK